MRRILISISFLLLIPMLIISTSCGKVKLTDAEKLVVGTYTATYIAVENYPSISIDSYDYFTIEMKSNKTCTVKSKASGTEYNQIAKWKVNSEGEVLIIVSQGSYTITEKYIFNENSLTGTNSSGGYTMTITLIKVLPENN